MKRRYEGSSAEHVWRRLNAMDFINRGMLFAAVLLLCFFPFLIVVNALAGRSAVTGISRHLGLNHQAAVDVGHLFASSSTTSNAVTGTGYVFFVLGGLAAVTAAQELYERAFELESRGMKDVVRRLAWLGILVATLLLSGWAGHWVRNWGGPVFLGFVALLALTGLWWFTIWFLLGGRVNWRYPLPAAVATALFWVGMQAVFSFVFSDMVISNNDKYGPIGVVFSLMSWLIAIGVVVILGAVVGVVWRERQLSLSTVIRRIAHRPGTSDVSGPADASGMTDATGRTGSGAEGSGHQLKRQA